VHEAFWRTNLMREALAETLWRSPKSRGEPPRTASPTGAALSTCASPAVTTAGRLTYSCPEVKAASSTNTCPPGSSSRIRCSTSAITSSGSKRRLPSEEDVAQFAPTGYVANVGLLDVQHHPTSAGVILRRNASNRHIVDWHMALDRTENCRFT
jgi:hypothetical protein